MRELVYVLANDDNQDLNSSFKHNMIELTNRLKQKFPKLDPFQTKKMTKMISSDVNYEEFDNISSDKQKLFEAINILTGSEIEMHPEIKERIHALEEKYKKCDDMYAKMSLITSKLDRNDGQEIQNKEKQIL